MTLLLRILGDLLLFDVLLKGKHFSASYKVGLKNAFKMLCGALDLSSVQTDGSNYYVGFHILPRRFKHTLINIR
jgi:hypothetical protein